jgi:hypothetical protein
MTVAPTYLTANASELVLTTPGFDDLLLLGTTVDDDGNEFHIEAQAAEATWDNPVPIDVSVQRWLTDGAVASTQGHDNRSPYFKVIVSAATSLELAAGERALAARAERIQRGEQIALLTWISAEGRAIAPAAVFEVWTWHLEHEFDADRENRVARMYGVRCTAKPWVRSLDLTQVTAATILSSPTVLSIDTCASLTGWTGSPNAATLVGGTSVRETYTVAVGPSTATLSLTRTGTVTGLAALPYLAIDSVAAGGTGNYDQVLLNGTTTLTKVAQVNTVSYYKLPTGTTSFTSLTLLSNRTIKVTGAATLTVSDVSATDSIGSFGSTKQLARHLDVGGSVPTSGSLELASPSSTALGTVLVYTCFDDGSDYSPPMRQYRTSGNTVTADGAAVSGNHEALVTTGTPAGTITFTVPAANYREASYAIVGRFFADSTTTLTATVTAAIAGYTADSIAGKITWPTANTWQWGVVGALTLPPQPIPVESALNMVITLAGTGSGTITFDELYLLDVTHGTVSLIACGATATRLWLNAPDADPTRNRPTIYIGTLDDRSDAVGARYDQILSLGEHDLAPEGASLLTVTDGVGSALASASFYRRWHTQPAA